MQGKKTCKTDSRNMRNLLNYFMFFSQDYQKEKDTLKNRV